MSPRSKLALMLALSVACSSQSETKVISDDPVDGDGDPSMPSDDGSDDDGDDDEDVDAAIPDGCGNGVLTKNEACDDGNRTGDDGCSANCLEVAPGVTCAIPGEPCRPFARCGDSVVAFPEQCDDGGTQAGDGCSAACKVEIGFKCDAAGGADSCTRTTCGDGVVEGTETCDDDNNEPLDGCSAKCFAEPNCSDDGCTSTCGDGIVLGASEDCDDGNTLNGDGCSDACQVEAGYECSENTECEKGPTGACVLRVPVVYRDFGYAHSDFESDCAGDVATTGLVENRLVNGKPVGTDGDNCTENLNEWYVNIPGTNVPFSSEIVLYDDGRGGFVNRYGPNGEKWVTRVGWMCTSGGAMCEFDGNPFFFPVDGIPGALDDGGTTALISTTEYGMDGTVYTEQQAVGSNRLHNFAFTSEVTYWFQYVAGTTAKLDFNGDDDVWVFVNGRLALDLGGLHPAVSGSLNLDATFASNNGLQDGRVYEIKVFHAERKSQGSTFRLTLSGFATARSDCQAVCGDGIIGAGEECDDGTNDGGYNECATGCVLGPYCGDGVMQEQEDCDDGNRVDDDDCSSSCRNIILL